MSKLNIAIVPVTPFEQNCTLMWDEDTKRGVIIDPGGDTDRIREAVNEIGMEVEQVLLTHGHLDHVGGAMEIKADYDVRIVGPHIDDKVLCDAVETVAAHYNMPDTFKNVSPDQWLKEGDTIDIAGFKFDVLHCPGHAPGHVVFFSPELNFAHVGDVLFSGSVGRSDLPGGNHEELIRSIKTKLMPLGDDVTFICGHGPGSTFGEERINNPFLQG